MSITKIEPNLVNASANFTFNNVTATGNLSSLNANLGNLAQANYFSGSGANLTNLPAGNISGQVGNALISGTVYTASQPNITSVGTLTGLTSTGTINLTGASNVALGPVGNVRITGGSNGQYLQTDGSGILSWSTVASGSTSNISNGNSNVNIPSSNGNVNISAVGNANILVITGTGANITGTLNVTGNTTVGNLTTSGSGGNVSNVNVISANTFIASGNITSGNANLGNVVTANFFIGSGNNLSNIQGANVTGAVSSATTASTVTTASQPNITSVGTLSSLSATGNITSGNANLGNLVTANFFTGNGSLLTGITVSAGNTIVSGNSNVLVSANGNVTTSVSGNANILVITGTGVNVAGTLNVTGNATVGNLITAGSGGNVSNVNVISANTFIATGNITSGNANLGNAVTANFFIGNLYGTANLATTATTANSVAGANVSGQVANALVAGTVYTNAQPNITSVGTLTDLSISGNAVVAGNLVVSGNTSYINVETLTVEDPIIELGGGVNAAPLSSNDGKDRGTLLHYYTSAPVDAFIGWDNSNAEFAFGSNVSVSSEVVTFNSLGNVRASYFIGNGSQLTGITAATSSNANYANYAGNAFSVTGSNVTGAVAYATTANAVAGANVSGNVGNALNAYAVAGANVSGQVANALVAGTVYTNAQPNITSVGTLTSLDVTGNITSGNANLGNLVTANFFTGNGSLLTGITVSAGNTIVSGNSNVLVAANGNVTTSVAGNANIVIVTGTGVNVAGTLNVTGNATVGNLITAGSGGNISNVNVISANTFIATGNITAGNINTTGSGGNIGNANVISANTFIATGNITVSNANLGNAATANYFIGNLYGTANLATYATTANAVAGGNVSGQVANALVAGTVYTNAQPNITSVGTLTSLGVTGNITSGNANLGNLVTANFFTGNGIYLTGITTAGLSNGNSNVNIPSANGNILVTVAGNANIVSFTGVGLSTGLGSITRPANVSANSPLYAVSNIDAPPISSASSNANIVVVTGTGANITGTANISGNLTAANLGGPLANGNSNVRIATSNGNINLTAVGNTVMVVTGTGANISGTLDVTGNLTAGNIITAGGNVSNVNVISANTFIASGNITGGNANLGNTTTANFFIGSGNNLSNIQGANVTGAVGLATFATTANAIAGANISGQVSNALVSGTVYTNAQPNITSIGSLTGLTVSNASGVVDFTTTANVTLGAIANLHISGGTANYVLNTDGAGNLSWVAPPGGANVTVDNFTGNGVQTIFTLSTTPIGINQTSVNYNGATVLRTDYTLANANITFSSAPENGSLIEVTTINLTSGGGGGGITAQDLLSPFLLMGA